MKHLTTMFLSMWFLLTLVAVTAFAQDGPSDDRMWSRININPTDPSINVPYVKWDPAPQIPREYFFGGSGVTVYPNFRPFPTTNSTQSETSVDVHPLDESMVFASANATPWPVSGIYGTGVYWTFDGGASWNGGDVPPWGTNLGDPCSVIGSNGYMYEAYISGSGGMGMGRSTNGGVNWTGHNVNSGSSDDKEHMMVDKDPSSPYVDRLHYVWTPFGGFGVNHIVYKRSTDFGSTWSAAIDLSGSLNAGNHSQGCNVQTGPNGEVYVAYAIYDNWPTGEDAIGFSKSTDGGVSFTSARIYGALTPNGNFNFGIRGNLASKNSIRVSSFPSMAVDRSGGATDGYIYITWPQRGVTPAGNDPDIVMIRSTDGGATWSSPIRINDDAMNNGKDQYYSWMTVDQSNGRVILIWYDSRDVPNNQAEVFMAYSDDGGLTFTNVKVSDQAFTPSPIPGLAGGYQGDYIGVAALNDVAYGYWADNRTGIYQGWMVKVEFSAPCPVEGPTNPAPANNATNIPISLAQLTWTNGTGANSNELYFGTDPGSLNLVQSGSLATSWNIPGGTLQYSSTYYWRVIEVGDTCNQSGPIWNFTTETDPTLVTEELYCDDFEAGSGNWTITNDGGTCVWQTLLIGSRPYTMPATATGNGMAADADLCGSGTTVLTTATLNTVLDLTEPVPGFPYTMVWLEFDNDWRTIDAQDEAHVEVSTNGGTSWTGVWDQVGTSVRNTHEIVDLSSYIGQADVRLRMRSVQPGWDWWWVVDNFCIYGEYVTPVELTSFTATAVDGNVELNWATASETNNQGFEIQRKALNGQYSKVGYVSGYGTSTETHSYTYTDTKVAAGSYSYRLKQIDYDGSYEYSNEVNVEVTVPLEYALEQNYPNPFNPSTTIKYSVAEDGLVKLSVYNMLGEEVASLVNTTQKAGRYEVTFNASNLASGVYVYRIETPHFTSAKKLMLMK